MDADPGRLDQVLSNLLANALRHTPRGGEIVLSAEHVACPRRGTPWRAVTVADNGEGIAAEDLPHVFERYWKRDPALPDGETCGSGLGLAIARRLVEAHGGSIAVSTRGRARPSPSNCAA